MKSLKNQCKKNAKQRAGKHVNFQERLREQTALFISRVTAQGVSNRYYTSLAQTP